MSRHRTRLLLVLVAVMGIALLVPVSVAQAKGFLGSGIGPNIGPDLNPLPSAGKVLKEVVDGFFGALLSALTPGFLKHADIDSLEWLVELPDVADASVWPNVSRLEGYMVWVAGAILPTTLIIATARDTALSLTFRANPSGALMRTLGAVFALVIYRFAFRYGVAFVDVLTHTILSWPIVAQGLHRTILVMFGGALLTGAGGQFLAVLGIAAVTLAVTLFALKVLILTVTAILFVAGPLFIGLTPLPVVGYLSRGWLLALTGVCLIPIGWCIVFAVAGAISLDVTNLEGGAHIGSRIVGAFSTLATFYIALKWPVMVLGHVRGSLGGLGVRPGGASGGGGGQSDGALAAKAQRARTSFQASMFAGGRGIGLAAGQLGAPRGGPVGFVGRQARRPFAAVAATGAIAASPPRERPRRTATGERIARAGDQLRGTPGQMREAWRAASEEPSSNGSGSRGAPNAQDKPDTKGTIGAPTGRGAQANAAATPNRSRRQPAEASAAPAPKSPPAGGSPPGSAEGASSTGARWGGSSTPTPTATSKGSRTSTSRRPPVLPPARSPQADDPPSPEASGRNPQVAGSGRASEQVSAPAQPSGGGSTPTNAPRPGQGSQSTTKRSPREPSPSKSSTRQPAARDRSRPNPPASRSTRAAAQPRQPDSSASRSTSTPSSRPQRRPRRSPGTSRAPREGGDQ